MQLDEFVKQTLVEVVNGVEQAQAAVKRGIVNPTVVREGSNAPAQHLWGDRYVSIHPIEFDVAVTVSEVAGSTGAAGIMVLGLGVGARGQSQATNETVSRVKFTVTVAFPPRIGA